jgi:hypothetical protein
MVRFLVSVRKEVQAVIPAKAGIQHPAAVPAEAWIPVCTGMTLNIDLQGFFVQILRL